MAEPEADFSRTFYRLMITRIGLALAAMALSYGGAALGDRTGTEWGAFVGALTGLAVGIAGAFWVLRRTGREAPESSEGS